MVKGNAIDSTWSRIGVAYAGVPFDLQWLNRRGLVNKAIICVLDDYHERLAHPW